MSLKRRQRQTPQSDKSESENKSKLKVAIDRNKKKTKKRRQQNIVFLSPFASLSFTAKKVAKQNSENQNKTCFPICALCFLMYESPHFALSQVLKSLDYIYISINLNYQFSIYCLDASLPALLRLSQSDSHWQLNLLTPLAFALLSIHPLSPFDGALCRSHSSTLIAVHDHCHGVQLQTLSCCCCHVCLIVGSGFSLLLQAFLHYVPTMMIAINQTMREKRKVERRLWLCCCWCGWRRQDAVRRTHCPLFSLHIHLSFQCHSSSSSYIFNNNN